MPKTFIVVAKRYGVESYVRAVNVRAIDWANEIEKAAQYSWGESLITMRHIISLWGTGQAAEYEAELGIKEWTS